MTSFTMSDVHYESNPTQRFWAKVKQPLEFGKCWEWAASQRRGYGRLRLGGRRGYNIDAHRFAYEQLIGPIPKGKQLDHLCHNRVCVNPFHLEVVTNRENQLRGNGQSGINSRKTHCKNGHPLTEENLSRHELYKKGWRICKRCISLRYYAKTRRRGSQ